jgi:hypothetical protein
MTMRERIKILPCLVAVGLTLAPLLARAEDGEGFTTDNIAVGLEFNTASKGLHGSTVYSGTATMPISGGSLLDIDNTVKKVKLTQVLARASYQVNDQFRPYVLLGSNALSFDDRYNVTLGGVLATDTSVGYSDSFSLGYGLGFEGVLMKLPEEMKLTYGVRMVTFSSSAATAVPPEDISNALESLNPAAKVQFSTDATYREWDVALAVSRDYEIDSDLTLTPQIGYRHASISMKTSTDIEFSPGMPNYLLGKSERSLGGSLSSVTLGAALSYQSFIAASLQLAVGDETSLNLAVTYGF